MNSGRGSNASPQPNNTAGAEIYNRVTPFGEQAVVNYLNGDQSAALSGDYYIATNPTPGTGIATIASLQTLVDTSPFILVTNLDSTRTIVFDYLKLICTVAGTNGTNFNFAIKTDNITTRFSSGGSVITPVNPNQSSGNAITSATIQINAGALIANAANAARLIDHVTCRVTIPVVGDTTYFNFGGVENSTSGAALNGSTPTGFTFGVPPVVIGPGTCCAFHVWSASQTVAANYEFSLGFIFR